MTARNRLRKRAAQKAKVTTFKEVPRSCNNTEKTNNHIGKHPSQLQSNALTPHNAEENEKESLRGDPQHNSINSNQSPVPRNVNTLIKGNSSYDITTPSSQNNTVILASTAATINPKSNQVHTVVVSNSCNSNTLSNTEATSKNGRGKKMLK